MRYQIDNIEYGKTWDNITIDTYSGFGPRMNDYHMHTYYEISLITEGDVTVFLSDVSDSGRHCRIVLLRPYTPHFIMSDPDIYYSRTNLLFTNEFIADYVPEWSGLSELFGANGSIISLSDDECKNLFEIMQKLKDEPNIFRKKLILLYFLSNLKDIPSNSYTSTSTPEFIADAVSYLTEHYAEKITAHELAEIIGIGRTTLMTEFKKYIGTTMNEYLTQCRLKNAIKLMRAGTTIQETAEKCGYSDGCCLIRVFKKRFNVTPMEYIGKKHR
ncbi:MAG: helix-turn-helix domain-containing protein [Ruminococcaceae bacterium]|nr:helix-turn-helix domain-containing protein [Oscillospiraceae bacterium]